MIQIEVRQLGHLPCLYSHLSKAWLLHVLVATERFIQLSTCLDNKAVDHTKKIKKRTATEGYRDEGGALGFPCPSILRMTAPALTTYLHSGLKRANHIDVVNTTN